MSLLTLTTDWGNRDHHLAAFKGEILRMEPGVNIIDISHEIERFNIIQASYILKNSISKFPTGTIHYIGVHNLCTGRTKDIFKHYLGVIYQGQLLIGFDTGIFSLIFSSEEIQIFKLPVDPYDTDENTNNQLMTCLGKLLRGTRMEEIGTPTPDMVRSLLPQPAVSPDGIRGAVIYIDANGNVVTNIRRELFEKEQAGRRFTLFLRKEDYNLNIIKKNLRMSEETDPVAYFNSSGYLEIALIGASASGLLGLKFLDTIRIEFE